MKDKAIVYESDYDEEWYQPYFICSVCKCQFMTYLDGDIPHNYCPNCGSELVEEGVNNG